jgi:hypothetical protein
MNPGISRRPDSDSCGAIYRCRWFLLLFWPRDDWLLFDEFRELLDDWFCREFDLLGCDWRELFGCAGRELRARFRAFASRSSSGAGAGWIVGVLGLDPGRVDGCVGRVDGLFGAGWIDGFEGCVGLASGAGLVGRVEGCVGVGFGCGWFGEGAGWMLGCPGFGCGAGRVFGLPVDGFVSGVSGDGRVPGFDGRPPGVVGCVPGFAGVGFVHLPFSRLSHLPALLRR